MSDWSGRRLHFIGIGGAGMSGLALVCARLGATVTGSDRAESSYMERLRAGGVDPEVGHRAANLPDGAEVVISTAISERNPELSLARDRGLRVLRRGALLAELCAEKRLIAVAGTHGKTTTTAMVAWALGAIGADPAFFVGGEVPGLGDGGAVANAGWGEGEWVVAEADESDGSFLELQPEVAVVTNIEMDHHSRWGSVAELRAAFEEFSRGARPAEFDASSPGPPDLDLAVPGAHNVLNARAALAAVSEAGFELGRAADSLRSFPGVLRRLELKGEVGGTRVYDDYGHHPTEVRSRPHGPARDRPGPSPRRLPAAPLLADQGPGGGVRGRSGARRRGGRPRRVPGARGGGRPTGRRQRPDRRPGGGRSQRRPPGDLGPDARAGAGPGRDAAGAGPGPRHDRRRRRLQALGGGRGGGRAAMSAPAGVERDFPLSRLTTVRTGGPAEWFARVGQEERLGELLAWAGEEGLAVGVVGSGSNLLIADQGFRGLAVKLDGELAAIARDRDRVLCGGGARLPSAAARAAGWGLSGLEFGINIPGTVGGAVRMNANAYGGQLAEVLEWVEVCTAEGRERRTPDLLGFTYRGSALTDGEVVCRASFGLTEADPTEVKQTLATMRSRRREAQPSGIKTFGSTFKNPDDPRADGRTAGQLLEAAGCGGLRVGGAGFSPKHANFVENAGEATTQDVVELMAEGRRRVHERFGVVLEPEVQLLGEVRWPPGWEL